MPSLPEKLYRHVPRIRKVGRAMIEEFEIFFQRVVYTKGYQIMKQNDQNDYLYFVSKGKCRIVYELKNEETRSDRKDQKSIIMGYAQRPGP